MKILADENVSPELADWLRDQGHDVLSVRDIARGSSDAKVLERAAHETRVVLTADKDFGDLVIRRKSHCSGVILLRFRTSSKQEFFDLFTSLWPDILRQVRGHFVTATNRTIRIRPLSDQ